MESSLTSVDSDDSNNALEDLEIDNLNDIPEDVIFGHQESILWSDENDENSDSRPRSATEVRDPRVSLRRRRRTCSLSATISTEREPIIRTNRRTIYTQGRPPWYNSQGQLKEPFVIGICGGSASGKTTVASKIIKELGVPWVTLLSLDSFYKVLNEEQHNLACNNEYNFDHPDAFDFELLSKTLKRLKEGKKVEVPIYNFVTHRRETKTTSMYGANVLIFEGILAFHRKDILNFLDMKIFVDADPDIRLCRRLKRDIQQRGREMKSVLEQYDRYVKPAFEYYIAPTMAHADIIVPRGGENKVAIDLIVRHVQTQLDARGFKLRPKLVINAIESQPPDTLQLLPPTPQIRGLHTYIRNRNTPRDEFIFYSKRLIRLVIEYALSLLPYLPVTVDTPQGVPYEGKLCSVKKVCGVSILRAGETMEASLTEVCKDIRVGKILIQTSHETGEPELYYLRLPKDIKDFQIILMDATVATGAAAMMAIRVLLDHDVPEGNISLVSLLMAVSGVHTIAYAFPEVKIVTTAVDKEINEKFHVVPGIGNFGDRYFGTEPMICSFQTKKWKH
ncbi:uridine-cytidine kinase-like 1 [Lepeophtheirus salmonis]|uniref:Uridine kinase n=1 Tax=Lepeophtheirus salmonis TaxID=72036 RepID=A0A0K2UMR0_LEPSM|nr:uridine-cytidine kinase-like 1 [Lepeophtheirus salmonis]XP_040579729.1 uridine-cytidine kinase-like 1 [Lepeophtheirus salmonis]XP_040579730.1 uridine-cytidine kinase-like 1 [Lepeophtheirus salmonis]XP_040579731.1 uridine-cytidine kinase-like 1 [Lepeophtheirus salmonis]